MGQATFTVYVDNVGTPHAFIKIDDGSGKASYYGFAPKTPGDPHGPGKIGQGLTTHARGDAENATAGYIDDVGWSKTIAIDQAQHSAMMKAVDAWDKAGHTYNGLATLGGENCATFVQFVAKAGNITEIVTSRVSLPINLIPADERRALFTTDADGRRSLSEAMTNPLKTPGTPAYEFKEKNPELFKSDTGSKSVPDAAKSKLHENKDGSLTQVSTHQDDGATYTTTTDYTASGAVKGSMTVISEYDREESWWRERSIGTTYDTQGNETVSHRDYVDRLTHTVRTQPDGDTMRTDYNYSGIAAGWVKFDGANNDPYRWTAASLDSQGRETNRRTGGDDGTQHDIEFDSYSREPWRQFERLYDAEGREDWVRITQDDGAVLVKDFDQKGERSDSLSETSTDAQGREDWQRVTQDDGAVRWRDPDQKNERGDRTWESLTDAQGREDWRLVTQDSGRSDRFDFDQDSSKSWSKVEQHFDAQGREDNASVYNDDGSRLDINYDQDGTQSWSQQTAAFNAFGVQVARSMTFDNGIVSNEQGSGSHFSYSSGGIIHVYDPYVHHDGGRDMPPNSACVGTSDGWSCEPRYGESYGH